MTIVEIEKLPRIFVVSTIISLDVFDLTCMFVPFRAFPL